MPMPVSITPLAEIPDVLEVKTGVFSDARGYFSESWSKRMWQEAGFEADFVQDNVSKSARGTLRGLHYQIAPHGMGKLVRCLQGAIFDVAVDVRPGSPTFGQWAGRELTGENHLSLWIPVGFAHGFLALTDNTIVHYKCTASHAPESERALSYRCPQVAITWPAAPEIVSEKDEAAPSLDHVENRF